MTLTELTEKWMTESKERRVDEDLVLMNMIKMRMNKPVLDGFVVVNMRTGKTRKVKVGEFKPLVIDYSDPSPMDDDLVLPERKEATKHGKKK
jgi:hypothetical protein